MDKKLTPLTELADKFDLPADALAGEPKVTITGTRRVMIENHKGLSELSHEHIAVKGRHVTLHIRGEELELIAMTAGEVLICGQIFSVELE